MFRFLLILSVLLSNITVLYAADSVSVGAILPLSGRFASFGNKALQGIELSIETYNHTENGKKRPVRLLIKDSQGLPEVAERAVGELDSDGVIAVIGPILGVTADSAAKAAQKLGIPIITMTQKEGIADIGEWVFRNSITNASQVRGLADIVLKQGIRKVAILYPDTPYGKEMSALFGGEISKAEGQVVYSHSYKEGKTDFGPEIKAMAGPEFLAKIKAYADEKERRFKEAEKSKDAVKEVKDPLEQGPVIELERPKPDFDAVFIPDYAERIGLIVPQLAFYDVKGVKLLGLNGWNSPKLIKLAGDFLNDVIFVDGFFVNSVRPQVREFVEGYRKTFQDDPGIVEAQAYDTMGIVISVMSNGGDARESFRDAIYKIKDYHGATGDITFKGRDADRNIFYLTVNRGGIEELNGP